MLDFEIHYLDEVFLLGVSLRLFILGLIFAHILIHCFFGVRYFGVSAVILIQSTCANHHEWQSTWEASDTSKPKLGDEKTVGETKARAATQAVTRAPHSLRR